MGAYESLLDRAQKKAVEVTKDAESWATEYAQLKNALTEKEYEAARESTLTAFYTPPSVIHPIYRALERFGVKGGNVLDPCMGIGNFYGYRPSSFGLNDAKLYGVELDKISGRIAKLLYQKANIQIRGYEDADIPDNFFDLVIGNVPFGDFRVNDTNRNRRGFLIHDYFAAKMVDDTRMFGATVLITSSGTMDKQSSEVRRYLAARAELIGAVRLPNTVFKSSAGTKVTMVPSLSACPSFPTIGGALIPLMMRIGLVPTTSMPCGELPDWVSCP